MQGPSSFAAAAAALPTEEGESSTSVTPCQRSYNKTPTQVERIAQQQRQVRIRAYGGERDLKHVRGLIDAQLSEPYTVYTYRYFLNRWPHLCLLAVVRPSSAREAEGEEGGEIREDDASASRTVGEGEEGEEEEEEAVGVIIGKLESPTTGYGQGQGGNARRTTRKGYIGMISIRETFRRMGLAKRLLKSLIAMMIVTSDMPLTEIFLETEVTNGPSLRLYESVGFHREKRLFRFYLNGNDSFRLVLPLPEALFHPKYYHSSQDGQMQQQQSTNRITREQESPDRSVLDRMVASGDIM